MNHSLPSYSFHCRPKVPCRFAWSPMSRLTLDISFSIVSIVFNHKKNCWVLTYQLVESLVFAHLMIFDLSIFNDLRLVSYGKSHHLSQSPRLSLTLSIKSPMILSFPLVFARSFWFYRYLSYPHASLRVPRVCTYCELTLVLYYDLISLLSLVYTSLCSSLHLSRHYYCWSLPMGVPNYWYSSLRYERV